MALLIVPSLVGRLSFGEELTRRRRGGLCLPEKDPLYPKCISPDLSAILIQKDDAEAQGIRANPRQKNRLRGKASASSKKDAWSSAQGVLSRQSGREILNVLAQSYPVLEVRCNGQPRRP